MSTGLSTAADALLNYWALGWSFHVLPREPFDLFDANIFYPRPDTLAYSEHLFGIVLLVWPVFLLTGNLVLAYNVAILAPFVLSGAGMYLLAREITASRLAALLAGMIYLAAPYRFGHLVQIQLLSFQWFPFVFFFLLRFLKEGRLRQLGGVVLFSTLQVLSSNYYAVYLALAIVLFALVLALAGRELPSARKLLLLASGAAVVSAIALPFFLPYQRNRDRGFYRRYEEVVHFSASFRDYVTPSSFHKAPHLRWLPSQSRSEKALFLGFGAMALAGIGIAAGPRGNRVVWIFFTALTAAAVLLSLGPEWRSNGESLTLPYRFFYRNVPGFGSMRVPARIAVLAILGVSVLAGMGAARVLSMVRRGRVALAAGLLAFLLYEYQTHPLDRVLPEAPPIPAVHEWLRSAPPGPVLVLPIYEGDEILHESVAMYYSTAHFHPLVNGYSGWWPNDYWELVGRLRHFPTARSLRFLMERAPVRYIVVHYDRIPEPRRRELAAGMERYREKIPVVFQQGSDVVYEVRDASDPA